MSSNSKRSRTTSQPRHARLSLEALESRLTPYSISGNAWIHPEVVTIGFVPDGTIVGADASGPIVSNLQASFNARFGSASTWQNQILKAAQVWAQQANLNIAVIADNGAEIGSGLYQQGDPNMADIRIGGYAFGSSTLAQAYAPPPVNNYSIAGDIQFNTALPAPNNWNVGTKYDLFTVASHEFGHSLGLYHSALLTATMYGSYTTTKATLNSDDIAGIQAIYGTRPQDSYDAATSNGTFAAASNLTSLINTTTKQALATGLDLTTTSDLDFYKFTAPTGTAGTMTLKLQTSGLSLLTPKVTVYAADQTTVLGTATAQGDYDGSTLTVSVAGIAAGSTYYIKVEGAETGTGALASFNTGKYALAIGFAGVAAPAVTLPNTQELNGNPIQGGGGQAVKFTDEVRVNTTTSNTQTTAATNRHAVGVDASGRSMIVWASTGQDGSGYGVYAQRYSATGAKVGAEFRVNTTTANDQIDPVVAMNGWGNSVVAWVSNLTDGSGKGIYAQRYDSNGNKVGSEFRVNTTTAGEQITPTVSINDQESFVIAWASSGQDGSGYGVYAQRFDLLGNKVGSEFRVNATTANDQLRPSIALDEASNILVSWSSDLQDGSGFGIYARSYDWLMNNRLVETRVNTTTSNYQDYSSVAVNFSGNAVITWTSNQQDGSGTGIYARRLNASGQFVASEFLVNATTQGAQEESAAAMDNEGNFIITWTGENGAYDDIYAQQFTSGGAKQGTEFLVNTTISGDQDSASVAISSYGNAVVVWSGNGTGDSSGVFAQFYKVNAGSGLSNMEAGEAHGYSEEGCGCEEHAHHEHVEEDDHACGCGTCSVAVAVAGEANVVHAAGDTVAPVLTPASANADLALSLPEVSPPMWLAVPSASSAAFTFGTVFAQDLALPAPKPAGLSFASQASTHSVTASSGLEDATDPFAAR